MKQVTKSLLVTAALALTVTGCTITPAPSASSEPPAVDWSKYSAATHDRVKQEIAANDCAGMQTDFDAAASHKSTDLMAYLDAALEAAGCYK